MAPAHAQTAPATRDTASQGEGPSPLHRSAVTPALSRSVDPAARITHRAYEGLNASSVGLELGISVILGLFGGYYADRALGTTPWLMLLGLAFGLIAGFRGVLRYVAKADRSAARDDAAAAAAAAKGAPRG